MTNKKYNVVFAGTPQFAATALAALLQSSHNVIAVYTQPDRPAGRGQKLTPSPVKQLALAHHIPVYQPQTLRDVKEQEILKKLSADVMIVAAYGLILPKAVLAAPRLGCINIHASLLPRWRGAAPIQRAIQAGDSETGITIMQMDEGLDTGPMLMTKSCPIEAHDTAATLLDRLTALGADAVLEALDKLETLSRTSQDSAQATYAQKISKEEAKIDWRLTAEQIDRQIRAFNPWPVAMTTIHDQVIRVWETEVVPSDEKKQPGTIISANAKGIDIATGKNSLRLLKIQLPGGRMLPVADILHAKSDLFNQGSKMSGL